MPDRFRDFILGLFLHTLLAIFGGLLVGFVFLVIFNELSPTLLQHRDFVPFILAGLLMGTFAASRWFRHSASWVGVFGLIAIYIGGRELWTGWSPGWSHETRISYFLSQLFGVYGGCSDSECLYYLLFGLPFICFSSYSAGGLLALLVTPSKQSDVNRNPTL